LSIDRLDAKIGIHNELELPTAPLPHPIPSLKHSQPIMTSMNADNVTKPIEQIHPDNLPGSSRKHAGDALEKLVDQSSSLNDLSHSIHASAHSKSVSPSVTTFPKPCDNLFTGISHIPFLKKLVPGLEHLASKYHIGNYVMMRGTNEKFFESMPIYAR
jgi:phosphatidylserine decarboxylase